MSTTHPCNDIRRQLGDDAYLNSREAAEILGLSHHALARWRKVGVGPAYSRPQGLQGARYKLADLKAYLASEVVDPAGGGV